MFSSFLSIHIKISIFTRKLFLFRKGYKLTFHTLSFYDYVDLLLIYNFFTIEVEKDIE